MSENSEIETHGAEPVKSRDIRALTNAIDAEDVGPDAPTDDLASIHARRPKSTRRARVLDAEQVAASRSIAKPMPVHREITRDTAETSEDAPSKLSAVTGALAQLKARFQKADTVKVHTAETASDVEPVAGSVLAKAKESWASADNSDDEIDFEDDDFAETVAVHRAAPVGILARFDTAVMGVAAGIVVSSVALVLASSVLA